ncbi:threonine synthase [Nocardia brasiliensis]|uniref:threonine synthase n=1 Tax=Nocardia brasiliensis TaxID=37326 RepID=UPI001895EDE6|nr:pyridoxal-phosphate dependent enzyme [Nocardia brasiliensis]MBF6541730.1 pyridoxal-phosphate dependent enzyme [Nocardia brasiliensis]
MIETSATPELRKQVVLECRACGYGVAAGFVPRCPRCAGATDVFYDLPRARIRDDGNPLVRWFDLLPLKDFRHAVWLGEGNTPLLWARELGRWAGLDFLYLKAENANPSGTAKDRMAGVAMPFLLQQGVTEFVVSSTGNSSTSMGRCAARLPEVTLHIFGARDFLDRIDVPDAPNVRVYCVDADYVGAGAAAARFAAERGLPFESGFFNPARREGLKLAYLEAFDQLAPRAPDVVVQAVSSGMGVYGAFKGATEYVALGRLARVPSIVCAQQSRCAPMYEAFRDDSATIRPEHINRRPSGIAKAILRGNPADSYPFVHRIVQATGGAFEAVADQEILAARRLAWDLEGVDACLTSSVALACAMKLARAGWLSRDTVTLVNVTGRERPPAAPAYVDYV